MRRVLLIGTVGLAVVLAACAGTDPTADPSDESPSGSEPSDNGGSDADITGTWDLTALTVDGDPVDINGAVSMNLDEDGQIGGTAACNSYGGSYTLDGDRFAVGELAWTEMGCEQPLMETEQAYLSALQQIERVTPLNGDLLLTGGGAELRFEPVAPVEDQAIVGTTWRLNGLIEGTGESAAVTSVGGDPALLELTEDGRVSGSTGCMDFQGSYEISGAEIQITDLATDGDDCPPELSRQHQHVIETLASGVRAEVDGERLTLTAREAGLSYVAEDR